VYSLFLGYAVFHEEVTGYKIAGVVAIMMGVILLSYGSVT
jgi:drug/metabolite transporter (DMT)-like permease